MRTTPFVAAIALWFPPPCPPNHFDRCATSMKSATLGTDFDPDKSARVGKATVSPTEDGAVYRGIDQKGKPWTVATTSTGGIGWTDVWQADFDHNSRLDLMMGEVFPRTAGVARK